MVTNKEELINSTPLSLGFIGGSISSAIGYIHFASCELDNRWSVDAGCFSQNSTTNKDSADTYNVEKCRLYDTWKEMLISEKDRLDAIVVLLPTPQHYEVVTSCIENGFPVICEKSLSENSSEAEDILNLLKLKNGFLAVTYNYSGYSMIRELQHMIKNNVLGKIIHFQAEMPQESFIRLNNDGNKPKPQKWRLSDGAIPTIYLDLAVHLHQLINYLIDEKPIEVVANQGSFGWFTDVIDNVNSLCHYTNNIQGQFWFSKSSIGHRNGLKLRVYGTKGSAEWHQILPGIIKLSYSDGRREIIDRASKVNVANMPRYNRFKAGHPTGFLEAFANLYNDIAVSLYQYQTSGEWNSSNVFSAELAIEGLKLIEAMVVSSTTKKWEKVYNNASTN